ncbi:MAG: hypothetical protein ACFB0G_22660 [Leptolyngbyaceae cyanobacterium]
MTVATQPIALQYLSGRWSSPAETTNPTSSDERIDQPLLALYGAARRSPRCPFLHDLNFRNKSIALK